ncbi:hypothetical protein ALC60_00903 [Trachymyrmex zeteki]|uniref:Uncharacterized protein n=1 Tax=Mycetomoellerius zeteki TaxID=64791 RepID=A0A151XI56_9HYME|nr:hypothetical protein ALC60_00903 [Trachymyrmex zeteki]
MQFRISEGNVFRMLLEIFSASSQYPLNRCSRNGRFAVEKVSSAAAERSCSETRACIFRDCGGCAARKRARSVDGMEMSGTRSETDKRDKTVEMVSGGGKGSSERRRKKRSTRGGTEREAKRGRHYTNGREEHWERSTRASAPARGEGEEPSLRSFRPLARQTALRPTQKSRAFCGARSSLHLRTDPLTRCHQPLVRSFSRSHVLPACMQMHSPVPEHR